MAPGASRKDVRAGAEIVYGSEDCRRHSAELLQELGFPTGLLPQEGLEECGRVRATGFVWMKRKLPLEYMFKEISQKVSYATEVTAYVENLKMKKVTGVKSKQILMWVPIAEMYVEDPAIGKIVFRTPMGIVRSFPITAFMTEEEKQKHLEMKLN